MNKNKENTTVPHMKIFDDPSFPFDISKMRDLTPEENDSIQRYIDSISIDTGITFSDLENNKKTLNINDISDKR